MFKFWVNKKLKAFTLLESLMSVLMISVVFAVLISSLIALNTRISSLDKCMLVIDIEKNFITKQLIKDEWDYSVEQLPNTNKHIYYSEQFRLKWEILEGRQSKHLP